jgi:mycothiol synthase
MTALLTLAHTHTLPPGFTLRAATWNDLEPVADLIRAVCAADGDPDDAVPAAEIKSEWEASLDLETDVWVVTDPAGKVIGYEELLIRPGHASLQGDGYVHPEYQGLGIGTALLHALEARGRAEMEQAAPDLRVFIRNFMTAGDEKGRALHASAGFQPVRYNWSMRIKLETAPAQPVFPPGVEIRPFNEAEHLYPVYEAITESFLDHWGFVKPTFDDWKEHRLAPERYYPDLWFVAWAGDQVAGASICRYRSEIGWVWTLGVRRPWRKQGLGMALLLHSFGEFYRRGQPVIGLGVDASNPTGATRLYERAGMQIETEYVCYEKELRSGRELEE